MASASPVLGFLIPLIAQSEGDTGSTAFTFTVTREGDVSAGSTVQWAVTSSSATGDDFAGGLLPQGLLSFGETETQKSVTVLVKGDLGREEDELFSVALFNPVGATLRTSGATDSIKTASGGYGITEYTYIVAAGGDVFRLSYDMLQLPDRADIYVNKILIASTNGFVSGTGSLSLGGFLLNPNDVIKVRVTGNLPNTAWSYTINYPGLVSEANYIASGLIQNDDQHQLIREVNGVSLLQSASGAYLISVNGGTPVALSRDGQPVSASSYAGWAAIGATIVNGVINVLWRNGNTYLAWAVNAQGVYITDSLTPRTVGSTKSPEFFALEALLGLDINRDGIVAIAVSAGVALLQSASGYLISVNGGDAVPFFFNDQPVSASTFPGIAALGAAIVNGAINILWRDGNQYFSWVLNNKEEFSLDGVPRSFAGSVDFYVLEAQFGLDINKDGIVAIAVSAGVALLQSASGAYLISVNGGSPVALSRDGQPVSASSYAGWAAIGTTIVNGVVNVLWRNGNTYLAWALNAQGVYVTDSLTPTTIASTKSPEFFALEALYGIDINKDGVFAISVYAGVALLQSASSYLISVNGGDPVPFFFNGQPVSASTFPGIAALAAASINGAIHILWRDGNQYFSWVLNNKQEFSFDGIPRSFAGSFDFYVLEAQFGLDINNDGISAIAANAGVALLQSASGAYLISVNGGSPVALSRDGQPVSASSYAGWAAIGATIVNGVINVLWRNGNTYLAWALNTQGVYVTDSLTPTTIASTKSPEFFALEALYGIDINKDGVFAISVYAGVALLQSASGYLISVNGGDPVPFFFNGQPVSASTFPGIAALGAAILNGTINILWRDGNQYFSWVLNNKQEFSFDGIPRSFAGSVDFYVLEAQFGLDINKDGIVAIAVSAGVALLQSASGAYLISVNGGTPVALSRDGQPVSASSYAGWAAIGTTIVNGVVNVLWRNGNTYLAWALNAQGIYVTDSLTPTTIASTKSPEFFALEALYGIDINKDGVFAISVYAGVALLQSASSYLISVNGGDPAPFFFNGQPVSASTFPGFVAIGAATINGAINILWRNGTTLLGWVLDANRSYAKDSLPPGSFDNFLKAIEQLSGIDINLDGIISTTGPTGNNASNIIIGTPNDDLLSGLGGNDFLLGLAGADRLDGGTGVDTMNGGNGDDLYIVDNPLDIVTEDTQDPASGGLDQVRSSVTYALGDGSQAQGLNIEDLTLTGSNAINGRGNALENWLWGNINANLLEGLDGNDLLDGLGGFDTLSGGNGADIFVVKSDGSTDAITDFTPGTDQLWINTKLLLSNPDGYQPERVFSASEVNIGVTAQFTASSQLLAYGSSTGEVRFREASNIVDMAIVVLGAPGGSHPQLTINDFRLI